MLSLLAAVLVAGCATANGPSYVSVAQKGPKAGYARVVVYPGSSTSGWPIKLDGQPIGDVTQGGFMYRDIPAGAHQISGEMWSYPGITRRDFHAAPRRTYYFMVRTSDRAKAVMTGVVVGGLVGGAIASAVTSDGGGPVDIIPVDESTGRREVAQLKLAE